MPLSRQSAPPARAADDPEAEPLPLRLEDAEEAGRGPCRPHGERPPHGAAAAGGAAPDAAVVPVSSRRRGESCGTGSGRRGTRRTEVVIGARETKNARCAGSLFEICLVFAGFGAPKGRKEHVRHVCSGSPFVVACAGRRENFMWS